MFQKLTINNKIFIILKHSFIKNISSINFDNNILNINIDNKTYNINISNFIKEIIITDEFEYKKGEKALMILIKKG